MYQRLSKTLKQNPLKTINVYLILLSLLAALISLERYSFTTQVFLSPYNFLRLHEGMQILLETLASILISFLIFRHTSNNFELLKTSKGKALAIIFFLGTYFYATGNAMHELASFLYHTYCPLPGSPLNFCTGLYFNDYYFGNTLYFLGLLACNIIIILLEIQKPNKNFTSKDTYIMLANSSIYAVGLFVYATFDKVIIGMIFVVTAATITNLLLFTSGKRMQTLPFTSYCAFAYTLAMIAAIVFKFH